MKEGDEFAVGDNCAYSLMEALFSVNSFFEEEEEEGEVEKICAQFFGLCNIN